MHVGKSVTGCLFGWGNGGLGGELMGIGLGLVGGLSLMVFEVALYCFLKLYGDMMVLVFGCWICSIVVILYIYSLLRCFVVFHFCPLVREV